MHCRQGAHRETTTSQTGIMNYRTLGEELRFLILQSSRIYQQYRTSLSVGHCTKCQYGTPAELLIVNIAIVSTVRTQFLFIGVSSDLQIILALINGNTVQISLTSLPFKHHCHQTSFRPAQPYQCEKYFSIIIFISLDFKHDHFGSIE